MSYYKKDEFECYLESTRDAVNIKQYLSYVESFRRNFLALQKLEDNNITLDYLLENLPDALAKDKEKTVELLGLYAEIAKKKLAKLDKSSSIIYEKAQASLQQHLGIFKSYVEFIDDECTEPKNGNWTKEFKACKQKALQLLGHKIVLTHDELVENFMFRLATQDRFSYSRPEHLLFPARIYSNNKIFGNAFKEAFLPLLEDMKLIINDKGETILFKEVEFIEINMETEEVMVNNNLRLFTRTKNYGFKPQNALGTHQLSIDHIKPMEQIMENRASQWTEMEKVSEIIAATSAYQKSKTDIKGITNAAKGGILEAINSGQINKDKLIAELKELASEMDFEMMDRSQNSAKSNN